MTSVEEKKDVVGVTDLKKDDVEAEKAPAEPKTPPTEEADGDEEKEEKDTPTKGKRKAKATPKKEPTPKKEKKTTPKKETPKRKESGGAAHTMETRTRKKAREAVDFVVGGPQRAEVHFFIQENLFCIFSPDFWYKDILVSMIEMCGNARIYKITIRAFTIFHSFFLFLFT